jgi:hypothetical protein
VKAWDIFSYTPPGFPEPHPAVIVSHPNRVDTKADVNILMCSSHRAGRPAMIGEVILDSADGLDWPTLCRCDLFFNVKKADLKNRRGHVTAERRMEIIRMINRTNGWV